MHLKMRTMCRLKIHWPVLDSSLCYPNEFFCSSRQLVDHTDGVWLPIHILHLGTGHIPLPLLILQRGADKTMPVLLTGPLSRADDCAHSIIHQLGGRRKALHSQFALLGLVGAKMWLYTFNYGSLQFKGHTFDIKMSVSYFYIRFECKKNVIY